MPLFLIERNFAEKLDLNADGVTAVQAINGEVGVNWLFSFLSADKRKTTAWLYQEGLVDAEKFKELAPKITSRSYQFSFRVAGYGAPSGRFRVLDVLIDVATEPGSVVRIRDITRMGLPFPIQLDSDSSTTNSTDRISFRNSRELQNHG